MKQMKDNIF